MPVSRVRKPRIFEDRPQPTEPVKVSSAMMPTHRQPRINHARPRPSEQDRPATKEKG